MNINKVRDCPICSSTEVSGSFPYITEFNGKIFNYLKCCTCATVFVNPVPDNDAFVQMYTKDIYHDCGYDAEVDGTYQESVQLLQPYVRTGVTVLDYGCGLGDFLKELSANGFVSFGVEFDVDAANFASKNSSCKVWTADQFWSLLPKQKFDVIYLGDVLEHLPEPAETINEILLNLNHGGVLFVEGPLETNPSPVYWAIRVFGWVKHVLRPNFISKDPPHHLFRTNAPQQLKFFSNRITDPLNLKYWRVFETGWPYIDGGTVKGSIAKIAIFFGGKSLFGITFGNRFQAILIKK
jgi:2-polyprenyl-3-methyl-5-hydroxy-6-metoxy-1,4-benzoquinol methylase